MAILMLHLHHQLAHRHRQMPLNPIAHRLYPRRSSGNELQKTLGTIIPYVYLIELKYHRYTGCTKTNKTFRNHSVYDLMQNLFLWTHIDILNILISEDLRSVF